MNNFEYLRYKIKDNPTLRMLFFELTKSCNLKCKHCGSSCPTVDAKHIVPTEKLKEVVDEVTSVMPKRQLMFVMTGGEPLLRPDWFEICSYIGNKGYSWGMTTNATLIDDETIEKLREAKLASIGISLDGLKESHEALRQVPGCFDKAVTAIDKLVKSKYFRAVQIITVVSTLNIGELEQIYNLVKSLGVDSWKLTAIEPIGEARSNKSLFLSNNQYIELLDFIKSKRELNELDVTYGCAHQFPEEYEEKVRYKRFICGSGTFVASIDSDGNILPCLDVDRRELVTQGSIYEDSFLDTWYNKFEMFRENQALVSDKCHGCEYIHSCQGGAWHTWDFDRWEQPVCLIKSLNGGN